MTVLPARVFAALSGVALVAYSFLPASVADLGYDVFGIACIAAIVWQLAHGRLRHGRWVWVTFAAANALWVAGDFAFTIVDNASGEAPFPSVADGLYLLGYPFLTLAIVAAARLRGPRHDLLSAIDGAMVAMAVAIPVCVVWISPALDTTGLSTLGQVVSVAYPAMDLLLIVAGVRFLLGSGVWNTAAVLIGVGLLLSIVSDIAYNVELLAETYRMPSPVDFGWLASYALWGVAVLHPSSEQFLATGARPHGASMRSRAWIIGVIVLLPLGVVANSYVGGTKLPLAAIVLPVGLIATAMFVRLRLLARTGSAAWRAPALLTCAAMVVIAVSVGLTELHASTERQQHTSITLTEQLAQTEQIDGVATRAADGDPASIVFLQLAVAAAPQHLKAAFADHSLAATAEERRHLIALGASYMAALDDELSLILRGRMAEAAALDKSVVKAHHDDLVGAMRATSSRYRESGASDAKTGRIFTVALLLTSLLLLTLLLLRFGRATRSAELSAERGRAAADSERKFRALVGGSADILTVIDADTRVIAHAETVERVLGFGDGTIAGTRLDALLSKEQARTTSTALAALGARPDGASDILSWQLRRADGSIVETEASIVNHSDDPLLGGFVVNVRDISDRKLLEAELEHQAFHDPLTGLANRGLIQDRLRQALGRSSRDHKLHALLLLDVDDFKAVNDSLGHRLGDELIRQIAQRLKPYVREHDTLARVGGDEFALLIEHIDDESNAHSLADRLIEVLSEPIDLAGQAYVIRLSIGIALADGSAPGTAAEQSTLLLRNAELAMYEAKRHDGSSIELFAARMHDAVTKRLELKAELQLALQRNEFSLVYQPIVDVAERRIAGYEALVRWIHPERGMVSPADFIPVAEQTGLIVDLGTWVLREACRQLAEWQPNWTDERYVSVNVAGHQLQRDDFGIEVRRALADSKLPARQLLLEMTESSLIADTEGSERIMGELRDLGVRLAIDDFGTGYSSLSYLHRFSVDVLKIDKAFIDNITIDGPGNALVDAIVNMAGSLQLKVVAEGIEEPEQVIALALMRCELGQGYHYSRPLPVADVPSFRLAPGPAAPETDAEAQRTLRIAS